MRTYLARYRLRNGVVGVLHIPSNHSFTAALVVHDLFGFSLRFCSVRPA